MDPLSRNISSAGTTGPYLQDAYEAAVKNAEMALDLKREEINANDLRTWYENSKRIAKRREIEAKEQRLIETYVKIKKSFSRNES